MKVVIAGAGNVGSYLAADLHQAGHEVLLIETGPRGRRTRGEHRGRVDGEGRV